MAVRSMWRGHEIEETADVWRFADTHEPTVGSNRPCGHCGKFPTVDGHDACLGTLPGVRNACCGHGVVTDAYVQMFDNHMQGHDAVAFIASSQTTEPSDT